jgi:hypothetical protein
MSGEKIFRLLVRATDDDRATDILVLGGVKWKLGEWRGLPAQGGGIDFTCISYSWGSAFVPHVSEPGQVMSARAPAVVQTVIAALAPSALWVDAYCVPASDPERQACIRSLGTIYGGASQVVAVLSAAWAPAVERLAQGNHDLSSEVDRMGSDDWVARVWTYQEILNSPGMRFIAEGAHVSLSAMEMLSGVGQFMVERERALGIDAFALKKLHPRLDALQEVLAEWQIGSYLERPVFQLLSGMGTRDSTLPDDRYNAIIGIVTQESSDRTSHGAPLHAVETLLNACDAKGDFAANCRHSHAEQLQRQLLGTGSTARLRLT